MTVAVAAKAMTTTVMDVGTAGVVVLVAGADTRTATSRRAAAARMTAADACSEHKGNGMTTVAAEKLQYGFCGVLQGCLHWTVTVGQQSCWWAFAF
jgi:hypothetical protein